MYFIVVSIHVAAPNVAGQTEDARVVGISTGQAEFAHFPPGRASDDRFGLPGQAPARTWTGLRRPASRNRRSPGFLHFSSPVLFTLSAPER
jgi:hypothetical protein